MVTAGSLVPIFFMSVRYGPAVGLVTGALAGCAQLLMDAWIFHPVQVLLDYPIAWGLLGLAGLFASRDSASWRLMLGIGVAGLLRDIAHTISGVVWFSQFCPGGMNLWVYSIVYNASYMLPETLIGMIVVPVVIKRLPKDSRVPA